MSKLSKSTPSLSDGDRIKAAQGKGSYLPEEHERHLFHVKMDKPVFNPQTGEKGSKPFIQKFTVQDWRDQQKHGAHLGYLNVVLWDPEAYSGVQTPEVESPEEDEA